MSSVPRCDVAPQRLAGRRVARAGAAHEFCPLEAGPIHVGRAEHEILRAGLRPNLQPARLRPSDLLRHLGARHMEHLDRLVHQLRQRNGAMRRLALDHLRPRPGMVFRRAAAVGHQRRGAPADRLVVLAMHRHQRAGAPRRRQHAQELRGRPDATARRSGTPSGCARPRRPPRGFRRAPPHRTDR